MQTQKEDKIILTEAQTERAFWISLGTGVAVLIILALFLFTASGTELTGILDVRVFAAVLSACGFFSAWLTRRGRAVLGISLILLVFYLSVTLTMLTIAGAGIAVAMVTFVLTFGVTSAIFPSTRLANHATNLSLILAVFFVLLDIFQPFERIPNETPEITWVITGLLLLIYGVIIFRRLNSYSLRTKLLLAFLAVTMMPMALLAFINDQNFRQSLTNQANTSLLSAASTTATQLDTFMLQNLDFIRAQAQTPDVVEYLSLPAGQRAGSEAETRAFEFITAITQQNPVFISSVAIIDIKGNTLLDTFSADVGVSKFDRDYFQKPLETGLPYVSNMEFSQTAFAASIYFSSPVRDASGKAIGVFRMRYLADVIQDIVHTNNNLIGQDSFAQVVDGDSHVRLAHGTTPSIIFKSVIPLDAATISDLQNRRLLPPGSAEETSTNLPDFETALDNYETQPFFTAELKIGDNTLEQGAIVTLKTQNWHVIFAQPQDVFLASINTQVRNNLILTIVIALVVAGFAVLMATLLAAPLVRLTQVAEAIAGGDVNAQAIVESQDEVGTLAGAFNNMTARLREFIDTLEQRVEARTKDLATVAEVGTATATILETDKLLQEVVDLTKERFNLYHSHIYLLDETGQTLVLASGAGEPGRQMKAQGLSIPLNREQSLVARAARERKGVTVNDVTLAPDFLPNPLLPNTRSELAVPMIVSGNLIGVFDIQSDVVDRFTDSDINIQTTLAAQISTSIQNVRSFEQSKAQADLESLVNAIGQKIQRATSVDDTLQTAIREIGLALGASRVSAKVGLNLQHDSEEANLN